jgi:hypothetical protein
MREHNVPEIGNWYAHRGKGQLFQVVAFDEDSGLIELQDFEGDVDEVDLDTWLQMPLEPAAAPEDWRGPVEVEDDEPGYDAADGRARDWRAPIDDIPAAPQDLIDVDDEGDGAS